MKIPPVFTCGVAFAAAWAGVAWWPRGRDLEPERLGSKKIEALTLAVEKPEREAMGGDYADGREPLAAMALAGLTERPDLNAVFSAVGSARWIRLGLFLHTADSAAITALLARQSEEESLTEAELEMVWQQWVETDVKASVAWNEGDSGVWTAWARVDPKAALTAAGENARRLGPVIQAIGLKDPAWAERLMARYPHVDGATGWAGAVERLSAVDPAAAAALAMKKGAGWEKQVSAWTLRDPQAAMAWAQQIDSPALQRQAVAEVIRGWTRQDPAAGLREALQLPPGRTGKKLVAEAITDLARVDGVAARAAVATLTAGGPRLAGMAALAEGLAVKDPMGALEVLRGLSWQDYYAQERPSAVWKGEGQGGGSQLRFEGERDRESADTAVTLLTKSHPVETLNLLAEQHAGDPSACEPLGGAMGLWLRAEPEKASSWLWEQPPGAARDTGIETLISFLGVGSWLNESVPAPDYEAALNWAASAGHQKRGGLMENVLEHWGNADFDAAAAAGSRYGIAVEPPLTKSGQGYASDPFD